MLWVIIQFSKRKFWYFNSSFISFYAYPSSSAVCAQEIVLHGKFRNDFVFFSVVTEHFPHESNSEQNWVTIIIFSVFQRLIVEFSLENKAALVAKQKRLERHQVIIFLTSVTLRIALLI